MDIGKGIETVIIEPVKPPVPVEEPAPEPNEPVRA